MNEIHFYSKLCPPVLREYTPDYKRYFYLQRGKDEIDLEEFDIDRYCPTVSAVSQNSPKSSAQTSTKGDNMLMECCCDDLYEANNMGEEMRL